MTERIVTLAGREYKIVPLSIRASKEWRARFTEPLEQVVSVISTVPTQELSDLGAWSKVLAVAKDVLLSASDTIIEALFAYSPALEADKERIETEATDDEAFKAFVEVASLAFPFGGILRGLSLGNGRATESTSKSLPAQNGGSSPIPTSTR